MAIRPRLRFEVLQRDGFACRYCGSKPPTVTLHVDHIVPRAKGGSDDFENLLTACNRCNSGKAARSIPGLEHEDGDTETPIRQLSLAVAALLGVLWPFLRDPMKPLASTQQDAEDQQYYVFFAYHMLLEHGDVGTDNLYQKFIDDYRNAGKDSHPLDVL